MAQNLKNEVGTFFSGGPGTTGREVFEDNTPKVYPSGERVPESALGGTGLTGHHGQHGHHHHDQGLTGATGTGLTLSLIHI